MAIRLRRELASHLKEQVPVMRKGVLAAVMIALLPMSAYAQENKGPPAGRTSLEKKQDAEIDSAYREAVKKTRDNGQAAKVDPWQTIRPSNSSDNTKH
jgi:hypothetical protein